MYELTTSTKANALLTSVGPTTEAMQERMRELAYSDRPSHLKILRLTDGWLPFSPTDAVTQGERANQHFETAFNHVSSSLYLRHVFGRAAIKTCAFADLLHDEADLLLKNTDILVVPGGNTFQTMRGLALHQELLRHYVANGLPYVGESAGSIVVGRTLRPGALEPADPDPLAPTRLDNNGLRLINADIITHAQDDQPALPMKGALARLSNLALKPYETPLASIEAYVADQTEQGIPTYTLTATRGLSVTNGVVATA